MLGVERRVALDVLLACWGLGTWLGVNGMFVQLPLLVERLPEGWALPSFMTLAVMLGNSGLLIYGLLRRLLPRVSDSFYIYGLLTLGTLALTINAFVHTETVTIGGTDRSVPFLVCTFFAALLGCTSSVLFYPYLRYFRDMYLTTYLVGEGLSGFIPGILALIQGVGGEPECVPSPDDPTLLFPEYPPARFNSMVFMLLLGGLSALSLVSFIGVDRSETFASERVTPAEKDEKTAAEVATQSGETKEEKKNESLLNSQWVLVMAVMVCLNAIFNGLMPSIQSYSCMPYGTRAYHLAVTLGAMANPTACLAGVWLRPVSARTLGAMLCAALVPLGYILATALLSPTPPLYDSVGGEVLVVISWVFVTGVLSYARMWVYGWARCGGTRGMRTCGVFTQIGSSIGSVTLFLIVNYTNVFTQSDPCATY